MPRISFGMQMVPLLPPARLVAMAPQLEMMGFDRVWMPDHLLFPDAMPSPDTWSILTAIAAQTKRMLIGSAVSDPHRLHPALVAQRLATVDQISKGRVILGLGAGEVMNLNPFGMPWDKPVTRLEEHLTILRHLLDSTEPLKFEGQFYKMERAVLTVRPWRDRRIPVYMAAMGPRMQSIAGRLADGWLPVVIPPQYYGEMARGIEEAALAAGRPGTIEKVALVPLALTRDRERVLRAVRHFALDLVWPPIAERMGLKIEASEAARSVHYSTVDPTDPESLRLYREHGAAIPDEVLEKFFVYGDIQAIKRHIGLYVEQGATHINIINASPDGLGSTIDLAHEVLPYFSGRPPNLVVKLLKPLAPYLPRDPALKAAQAHFEQART